MALAKQAGSQRTQYTDHTLDENTLIATMHRVWSVFIKCFVVSFDSYSKFIYYSNWLVVYTHIYSSGLSFIHLFFLSASFEPHGTHLLTSFLVLFCFHFSPFRASRLYGRQANFSFRSIQFLLLFFYIHTIPNHTNLFYDKIKNTSSLLNLIVGSRYNHGTTRFKPFFLHSVAVVVVFFFLHESVISINH